MRGIRGLRSDEGELPSSSTLVGFENGDQNEAQELELRSDSMLLSADAVSDELCRFLF
jgi:hypothetical protein